MRRARSKIPGYRPAKWVRAEDQPQRPNPLGQFRLFAVLGTYNEEDIIEATVANAFAQGVERVYLVDNGSTDDTVARAEKAGATLAEVFHTSQIQETVRILIMNWVVWRISSAEYDDHLWWLWLDADEFPHGPEGQTIRGYLDRLDQRFRVVGSDFYQHFPTRKPEYVSGFHPLEFQPFCEPLWQRHIPMCNLRHYKHPLQRFDRNGAFLQATDGFHKCIPNDRAQLIEPTAGIVTHHFQYREEGFTRRRLEKVYGFAPGRGEQSFKRNWMNGRRRLETVDAVYQQRWGDVDNQRRVPGDVGVNLRPWSEFTDHPTPQRWYSLQDLDAARAGVKE